MKITCAVAMILPLFGVLAVEPLCKDGMCPLPAAPEEAEFAVLGRSWYSTANVWFVNCDYGDAINAEGWTKWNDVAGETTLREYGCRSNVAPNRPNGAGQWAEGILVTGSLDDFWTEFASFGYSDLRDILFASNDNGETKSKTYKPEIRPAVIVR